MDHLTKPYKDNKGKKQFLVGDTTLCVSSS